MEYKKNKKFRSSLKDPNQFFFKKNKKIILIFLSVSVVLFGLLFFLLNTRNKNNFSTNNNKVENIDTLSSSEDKKTNDTFQAKGILDSNNVVYMCSLNDQEYFFEIGTNAKSDKRCINSRLIYESANEIKLMGSYLMDDLKKNVYLSLQYGNLEDNKTNELVKINLSDLSNKVLIKMSFKEIADKISDPQEIDSMIIEKVLENQYLVIGFGVPGTEHGHSDQLFLLNLKSKNTKLYQGVINPEYDLENNKIFYKKLIPVQEKCIEGVNSYGCDGDEITVYKDIGEKIIQDLP